MTARSLDELDTDFWDRVDRPEEADACWRWTGRCDEKGYGRVGHRRVGAQRVAWALTHGGQLPAEWVLHRCEYNGENVRYRPSGSRRCAACYRLRSTQYALAHRDQINARRRALRLERSGT